MTSRFAGGLITKSRLHYTASFCAVLPLMHWQPGPNFEWAELALLSAKRLSDNGLSLLCHSQSFGVHRRAIYGFSIMDMPHLAHRNYNTEAAVPCPAFVADGGTW